MSPRVVRCALADDTHEALKLAKWSERMEWKHGAWVMLPQGDRLIGDIILPAIEALALREVLEGPVIVTLTLKGAVLSHRLPVTILNGDEIISIHVKPLSVPKSDAVSSSRGKLGILNKSHKKKSNSTLQKLPKPKSSSSVKEKRTKVKERVITSLQSCEGEEMPTRKRKRRVPPHKEDRLSLASSSSASSASSSSSSSSLDESSYATSTSSTLGDDVHLSQGAGRAPPKKVKVDEREAAAKPISSISSQATERKEHRHVTDFTEYLKPGYLVKVNVEIVPDNKYISFDRSGERYQRIVTGSFIKQCGATPIGGDCLVIKNRKTAVTEAIPIEQVLRLATLYGTEEKVIYERQDSFKRESITADVTPSVRHYVSVEKMTTLPESPHIELTDLGKITIPPEILNTKSLDKIEEYLELERDRARKKILRQVDYYFSPVNFEKDTFLQNLEKRNPAGIPIRAITRFNAIRAVTTNHEMVRMSCAKGGQYFGAAENGALLYRVTPLRIPINSASEKGLAETQAYSRNVVVPSQGIPALEPSPRVLVPESFPALIGKTVESIIEIEPSQASESDVVKTVLPIAKAESCTRVDEPLNDFLNRFSASILPRPNETRRRPKAALQKSSTGIFTNPLLCDSEDENREDDTARHSSPVVVDMDLSDCNRDVPESEVDIGDSKDVTQTVAAESSPRIAEVNIVEQQSESIDLDKKVVCEGQVSMVDASNPKNSELTEARSMGGEEFDSKQAETVSADPVGVEVSASSPSLPGDPATLLEQDIHGTSRSTGEGETEPSKTSPSNVDYSAALTQVREMAAFLGIVRRSKL